MPSCSSTALYALKISRKVVESYPAAVTMDWRRYSSGWDDETAIDSQGRSGRARRQFSATCTHATTRHKLNLRVDIIKDRDFFWVDVHLIWACLP